MPRRRHKPEEIVAKLRQVPGWRPSLVDERAKAVSLAIGGLRRESRQICVSERRSCLKRSMRFGCVDQGTVTAPAIGRVPKR